MQPTHNILSENIRAQSVELLNQHLAAAIDLHAQVRQAQWNVRGPGFIAIQELFDKVAVEVENYSDLIAERPGGLGGTAHSTVQVAAERCFLIPYPLDIADEHQHVFAVSGTLAAFGQSVREAIGQTATVGDATTTDLFAEISRRYRSTAVVRRIPHCSQMSNVPYSRAPSQYPVDRSQSPQVTARPTTQPSALTSARRAASGLRDRIEAWENEGGARDELSPMRALRILVAEDNAVIGALLAEMLEGMGHNVCAIAATEADAVAAAVRCRPDLMIVDVRLGDGSGVAAVEKIRRAEFVPHLFVSGDISRIRVLRPGAVVVQKPFHERDLARAIQRALSTPAGS